MRIRRTMGGRGGQKGLAQVGKGNVEGTPRTFEQVLQEAAVFEGEVDLKELLGEIDALGEVLVTSPNMATLQEYKDKVRLFLKTVLAGAYQIHEEIVCDFRGNRRIQVLVRQVDAKLAQLADTFVANQGRSLALVNLLDEIRGLLVDFFL
ncbi:MAG: YaaR family protein [Limnochordia bacterium]|jgi:uncharacterized protein YaaR (DUF327 family)